MRVTPATEQDRTWVGELAEAVQEATGESVELAYVDRGYAGEAPAAEAASRGIALEVVKHPGAKKGLVGSTGERNGISQCSSRGAVAYSGDRNN